MIEITKRDGRGYRVRTMNNEKSRTQQQFKDEVNVNSIMRKYKQTGVITHLNDKQGKYGDLSQVPDYFTAMQTIKTSQEAFDQLPSDVRRRFENDPSKMLAFVHDPNNYDEGVKLGIFNPKIPDPINPPQPHPPTNDEPNDEPKTKKTKNS